MFEPWLQRWTLVPDGAEIVTRGGHLLPVRRGGERAMLKLALAEEERRGAALLDWWDGDGSVRVLARQDAALLMERAEGGLSLPAMARDGRDGEACRILCATAGRLHASRHGPLPALVPLGTWFADLGSAADSQGGPLRRAWAEARRLLGAPREVGVLHGDLHHGNVLDFGARGWLAIDPKGLAGERGFDFANIFANPDAEDPARPVALRPGRLASRLGTVAGAARLEPRRLLRWIIAWAGLSAAWHIAEGSSPALPLRLLELAVAELDR
jgi:streptomycin 6-kinase